MDEAKLEEFIKKEAEEMGREREKNDYLNQEPFRTNRLLEENKRIIEELGLKPGVKVRLRLLDMEGVILEIREKERLSVLVKREDGEIFAYSPSEIEHLAKSPS